MATSFHFDLGNSTDGPIGFCARVVANSEEEALDILRTRLASIHEKCEVSDEGAAEEYITVYFNGAAVTTGDIDDLEAAYEDDDDELSA